MACMEHTCPNCGFAEFNNNPREPSHCPSCGAELRHHWDEEGGHH